MLRTDIYLNYLYTKFHCLSRREHDCVRYNETRENIIQLKMLRTDIYLNYLYMKFHHLSRREHDCVRFN